MISWKGRTALLGLGWLVSSVSSRELDSKTTLTKIPGAYIVELADGQNSNSFYDDLAGIGSYTTRMNITSSVLRAVSFRLHDSVDEVTAAKQIADMPQVKQMWPVTLVPAPKPEIHWTGAGQSFDKIKKRADGVYTPHAMTQVDKLHALGYTGKGIRIAIIDTGVDYNHPDLGGCFGPGCVVSFGKDMVGDAYDGYNTAVPDDDPFSSCLGHGTHVAGIVAAQANQFGFYGGAPDAEIGMYRVFGCADASGTDVLIAAFNQAFHDGSQIITASIGAKNGWSEEAWSVAVQRIVEAGVPCTLAAGNDGAEGYFQLSAAAGGRKVMGVASFQNDDATSFDNGVFTSVRDTYNGGFPSYYTSWGPMFELEVKPNFAAPGGGIMSTWPIALGSYAVLSGTSMATPLAASIVALVAQVRGTFNSTVIENLLASTAKPNIFHPDWIPLEGRNLAPVPQQGAGLIQAYDAAFGTTLLNVSSMAFNDTDNFISKVDFTLTNTGSETVTFNISHKPALAGNVMWPGTIYPISWVPDCVRVWATLRFEPETITLAPGAEGVVSVFPTEPVGLDPARLGVYSGYVALNGTNGENLSIPYQGVVGSMKKVTVLWPGFWMTRSDDSGLPDIVPGSTFVLPAPAWSLNSKPASYYANLSLSDPLILSYGALPAPAVSFLMGSAEARLEVIPLSACTARNATEKFGMQTIGNVDGFPSLYNGPYGFFGIWTGILDNGNYAPPGPYKISLLALKLFGDRTNPDDYEYAGDSVNFNIVYAYNDLLAA